MPSGGLAGLEFLLEIDAKLDGATKMLSAINQITATLGKTDKAIKHTEHEAEGTLGKVTEWFKELGKEALKTFTGMFAAEAVWDSIKEGVHVVGELISEMFHAAGEAERTRMAFENMLGAKEGRELLEGLEKFSSATEFTTGPVKAFGQQLMDAGFAGRQLNLALATVTDVAARSPNKMAGAERAMEALERIMLSGTLDPRALRALKLSPRAVFKQMGADLGMSAKEVQQKLQTGGLKTADVLNSVFKAVAAKGGGVAGKTGADMADGFSARFERFKEILPRLFEQTADSPGLKSLGESLDKVTKMFAPDSEIGKAVINGLADGMTAFADALKKIDAKALQENLTAFFKDLPVLIEAATGALGKFASLVGFIYSHTLPAKVLEAKTQSPEDFLKQKPGMARTIARSLLFGPESVTPKAAQPATGGLSFNMLEGVDQGLLGGAMDKGKQVGAALGKGVVAGAASPQGLDIHSPSKKFEHLGRMSAAGFEDGLEMAPPSMGARGVSDGISPAGGRGAVTVNAPISVHVAASEASPEDIADAIEQKVPASILAVLEQLGLVGGTT